MKTTLFTLLSLVALAIQISTTGAAPHRCTYVFYYQPVCGNDGKTYINSGHLTCEKLKHEGLKKQFDGKCPSDILETGGNVEKQFGTDGQPVHNPEQWNTPVSTLHNPETHSGAFNNYDPNNPGHVQGNYPGNYPGQYPGNYPGQYPGNAGGGMRWGDNSREYPDNSFEIKIGGGHGGMGGMGKGLIAGAILGKVASDYSKKHDKSKINPGGTYPMGTGYQQPSPVNTGMQQPKPYPMQPSPVNTGMQQPKPYPVQPSPVNTGMQQPKPYPVQPSPVNTGYQQPKPYPVQPSPVNPAPRPSPYNPYAPSAPAQPSKTNTNSNRGNSGSRKSGGGKRRKGRSVIDTEK